MKKYYPLLLLALPAATALASSGLEPLAWFAPINSYSSFAVWQDYIYAIEASGSLDILQLSDQDIVVLASMPFCDGVEDLTYDLPKIVAAFDGYLLIADPSDNEFTTIKIFDLNDPLRPSFAATIDGIFGREACFCPPYLYIIYSASAIHCYDLSDPCHPIQVGSLNLYGYNSRLAQHCDNLAVCDYAGLRVIDNSNPRQLRFMGSYCIDQGMLLVRAENDLAVVGTNSGASIFDLGDPWTPRLVSAVASNPNPSGTNWFGFYDRVLAIFNYYTGNLQFYDLTDPQSPALTATLSCGDSAYSGWYQDQRLLLLGPNGIIMVDVSAPAAPIVLNAHQAKQDWQAIAAWDRYIAISSSNGIEIDDVTDPARPAAISSLAVELNNTYYHALAYDSGLLFATSEDGFRIISTADPSAPQAVGLLATYSQVLALAATGHYAYYLCHRTGATLFVVDGTDPAAPQELPAIGLGDDVYLNYVAASQTAVYGAGNQRGLPGYGLIFVFSLADPAQPALVATLNTGNSLPECLAIDSDRLYVSYYSYGSEGDAAKLSVYDLTDPLAPALLGDAVTDEGYKLAAGGGVVARGRSSIVAYDAALLPGTAPSASFQHCYDLTCLTVNPSGVVFGSWGGAVGAFRLTEASAAFLGSMRETGDQAVIKAWTANPGVSQVELTYDGLGTGVFLAPTGDGSYELEVPLAGGLPAGQYLLGMRAEGNSFWRPNWPYLEVW